MTTGFSVSNPHHSCPVLTTGKGGHDFFDETDGWVPTPEVPEGKHMIPL